jgi:hypothetical protein
MGLADSLWVNSFTFNARSESKGIGESIVYGSRFMNRVRSKIDFETSYESRKLRGYRL